MKFIKKVTAIALAMSFFAPVSALAEELPVLTLQEASRRAVNNSNAIRNANDSFVSIDENYERTRDMFFMPMQFSNDIQQIQTGLRNLETQRTNLSDSIAVQRQALEFLVLSHFVDITLAEEALYLFNNHNLPLVRRDLAILNTMVMLGLSTPAERSIAELNHNMLLQNRVNLENAISDARVELNRLMGVSTDRLYNLDFEIEFAPLPNNFDLARHVRTQRDRSFAIDQAVRSLDLARFELDNHTLNFNMHTGMVMPNSVTRDERQASVNIAQRNVSDSRTQVEHAITDLYHTLRRIEHGIATLELRLLSLHQEREILEARLSVGQITQLELDRQDFAILTLQNDIQQQKAMHGILTVQFNNSNLLMRG